jgi:hypothetical protein
LTRGWELPNFRAYMEYPKLCQSKMSFEFLTKAMKDAMAKVGIKGGFYDDQI